VNLAVKTSGANPNVVVIVADDLGWGDLGCYGNPVADTPSLDRLAAGGVRFAQHYSASPMCAPARAALLTGRYPHRTGAVDVPSNRGLDRIDLCERTLADHFGAAGYATGMVGKWHNGAHDMRYHPNARGFDEFAGFLNGGMDYWRWVLDRNGTPEESDGRYLTDVFTEEAVSFVRRHREEPFFLYVAYNAPHTPLQAPEEDVAHFSDAGVNPAVAMLYAMVRRMDSGVGRIVETLEQCGLAERTVVLFTSDNGPWMGDVPFGDETHSLNRFNGSWRGMKGDVLEGGICVPALLSGPGLPAGTVSERIVHFCDWLPTLFSMAGAKLELGLPLDGRDVSTCLRDADEIPPRRIFWQWNRYEPVSLCNAAVRESKWKLYWPPLPEAMVKDPRDSEHYRRGLTEAHRLMNVGNPAVERRFSAARSPMLFDLEADPGEERDLASAEQGQVESMAGAWQDWFKAVESDRCRA
jgi:arylsulfatase B